MLETALGPVRGSGSGSGVQGFAQGTLDCYGTDQQVADGAIPNPVLTADIDCAVSRDRSIQAGWDTKGTSVTLLRHTSAGEIYISDGMTAYGTLYKCNAGTTEGVWHDVATDDLRTDATIVIECAGAYVEPPPPPPPLTCDEGEEVVNGVCVVIPPPPLTCEEGEEIVNGVCVVIPPPPLTCEEGEEIVNGVCVVIPPPPLTCEEGEEIVNGVCVVIPPPPLTCEEGEEVVNGVCVVIPPPPLTCDEGEEIVDGVCVVIPPPPLTCDEGEEVVDGVCVVIPPPPLTCDEGEEVVNGVCVVIPPPPLTCDEGEEIVNGVCVPEPPPPPPLTCPNATNELSINERFDTLPRPCAVSDDGKIRAFLLSEGGAIAIQSDLDSDVIHPSPEMRKGDQTIPGATAVFWCIADSEGSIWHTSETDATTITVECGA